MCGKLYWTKTIIAFKDEVQFEELSIEKDHYTANEVALQKLAAAAQEKSLAEYWRETAASGPPSAYCLPKNKMTEEQGGAWKARIIFSHFAHPIKARGKIIGRALSLLLKTATAHMHCFEMVDIRDVKQYAEQVQTSLYNIRQSGEEPQGIGPGGFRLWELDVVEMFPRLDRQQVLEALKAIHKLVSEARKLRGKNPQCSFALHHYDRRRDRMGQGSARHFTNLKFDDILAYVEYELYSNDVFVAGTRVLRQRRGVAIGGTCSAQLACLYCMYQEHEWYKGGYISYADSVSRWMHPRAVPLFPFRFRDNIVGVGGGDVTLQAIHGYFSEVYSLELQMEGEGDTLRSLEAKLSICQDTGTMGLRLKRRVEGPTDVYRSIIRYVDWYSTTARAVLQSLVPALVGKCVYYALSQEDVAANVRGVMRELLRKGYPESWWVPKLRYGLRRRGVPDKLVREELTLTHTQHTGCRTKPPFFSGSVSVNTATCTT